MVEDGVELIVGLFLVKVLATGFRGLELGRAGSKVGLEVDGESSSLGMVLG